MKECIPKAVILITIITLHFLSVFLNNLFEEKEMIWCNVCDLSTIHYIKTLHHFQKLHLCEVFYLANARANHAVIKTESGTEWVRGWAYPAYSTILI